MSEFVALRLAKGWQEGNGLIFGINPCGSLKNSMPKKLFLRLSFDGKGPVCDLLEKKPPNLRSEGAVVGLVRKHLAGGMITDILQGEKRDLWIAVEKSKGRYWMFLEAARPPFLHIVTPDELDILRLGPSGLYTKIRPFESVDKALFSSVFEDWLEKFKSVDQEDISDQKEEEVEDHFSPLQREARKKLHRRLKTVRKAFEKQKNLVPSFEKVEDLLLQGKLLQNFAYLLKPHDYELTIPSDLSGLDCATTISIDSEKSVGANIDQIFVQAKKYKKAVEIGKKRLHAQGVQLASLEADVLSLGTDELDDVFILEILKRHKIVLEAKTRKVEQVAQPYRIFKGPHGEDFLVGKGPRENDVLTKSAKSNDFWFHCQNYSGSHVILRRQSIKDRCLHDDLRKQGCILAVHFSKLREDRKGEVYITEKRHLRKTKNLPLGLWLVDQSKTEFTIFSEKEVQDVLNRKA